MSPTLSVSATVSRVLPTALVPAGKDAVEPAVPLISVRTAAAVPLDTAFAGKVTTADASPADTSIVEDVEVGLRTPAAAVPSSASLISGVAGVSAAAGSDGASTGSSAMGVKLFIAIVSVYVIPVALCVTDAVTFVVPAVVAL